MNGMMNSSMIGYYVIVGIIMLASWYVSNKLKSKFKEYSQLQLRNGMSGAEIAEKMLSDNGISNVQVISVQGQLTDHYNPSDKTVNLSEVVYGQRNAASAAVAAHEVGHAVQDATAYAWIGMRSKLVPMVSIASKFSQWVIMAGLVIAVANPLGTWVLLLGIILFAIGTTFAFVTLPVEYDASNRALAWLQNSNMLATDEHAAAKDALKWAARTYLVAALGSLATLLYFIMIFVRRR